MADSVDFDSDMSVEDTDPALSRFDSFFQRPMRRPESYASSEEYGSNSDVLSLGPPNMEFGGLDETDDAMLAQILHARPRGRYLTPQNRPGLHLLCGNPWCSKSACEEAEYVPIVIFLPVCDHMMSFLTMFLTFSDVLCSHPQAGRGGMVLFGKGGCIGVSSIGIETQISCVYRA